MLTHASYRVFRKKMSKVIKGVISGLKATKYGKNTKNHCVYKLHSRVTSVAYMHCYHQGSLGCQPFGGQRSLRGHFRSKTKTLKKYSRIFISRCKYDRVTWLSHMGYWYMMYAWYFCFGSQRSFKGHFRFSPLKFQEFLFPQ